ncbi:hypothetical protein MTO96_020079 [Rhipicephalus appendiculatus]
MIREKHQAQAPGAPHQPPVRDHGLLRNIPTTVNRVSIPMPEERSEKSYHSSPPRSPASGDESGYEDKGEEASGGRASGLGRRRLGRIPSCGRPVR